MRLALGTISILWWAALPSAGQQPDAIRLIVQPSIPAQNAVFSADGKLLVTAAGGNGLVGVSVTHAATGLLVRSIEVPLPDGDLAGPVFQRDSVLIGGVNGVVYTLDLAAGQANPRTIPDADGTTAMSFSPDSATLLAGGRSGDRWTLRVLDAATFAEKQRFTIPVKDPEAVIRKAELRGDTVLVEVGPPGKPAANDFQVWSLKAGRQIRSFEGQYACLSPDGLHTAFRPAGSASVELANTQTGATERNLVDDVPFSPLRALGVARSFGGLEMVFSPDGKRLARTGNDPDGQLIWGAGDAPPVRLKLKGGLKALAFTPDSRNLLTTSGADLALTLWDAQTGESKQTIGASAPFYQSKVAFAPRGTALAAMGPDEVRIWDLATGRQRAPVPTAYGFANFTPDGRQILSLQKGLRTIAIFNTDTAERTAQFDPHPAETRPVAMSADGKLLATTTQGRHRGMVNRRMTMVGEGPPEVRIWDWAAQKQVATIPEYHLDVAFSPNGRRLMVGAQLWDLDKNAEVWQIPGNTRVLDALTERVMMMPVLFLNERTVFYIDGVTKQAHIWDVEAKFETASYFPGSNQVALAPDHRQLYVASGGSVAVLDVASGRQLRSFEPATATTLDVSVSGDGKWVATVTGGELRLWDAASGKIRATLISFAGGQWAVVDPEGRYDAGDPDHTSGLHFAVGLEPIELRQLKQRFYTPGLLGRILRGERLPDVSGKLQQLSQYPEVTVTGPTGGKIQIGLKNRGGGLGRVVVKVNGREISADARPKGLDSNAPSASFAVDLAAATLDAGGKNDIEVSAYDSGAVVSSRGVKVVYRTAAADSGAKPRLFAIVSGVSEFAGGGMNLGFAAKDAEDMSAALRAGASRLFGAENVFVQVLSTSGHPGTMPPTKANFRKAFEDVAQKAQSSDVLVVYFAGHGMSAPGVEDVYYYLTQEARSADLHDAAVREIATVSSEELKQWCMRIKTVRQVIALDTCAAGAATQQLLKLSEKRALSPDQMRAIELFKDSVGSFVLMGSAADAVSYEANQYGQGLVTYALLKGMKGEALQEGQRLDVDRWFAYAQREVERLAKDIGGIQRPILSAPNSVSFPIAMLTDAEKQAIKLASMKPQLLQIVCNDDNDLDPLNLTSLTREKLRNLAFLAAQGSAGGPEAAFVYLDSLSGDVPGAVIPKVRYQSENGQLSVRITLVRNGAMLGTPVRVNAPADGEKARDVITDAIAKTMQGLK